VTREALRQRLRRLIDFLGSGRLAVVLLGAGAVVLYLYLVIPQRGRVDPGVLAGWIARTGAAGRAFEVLGLTDILGSWLFWAIDGLLILNLSVCLTRRLPWVVRRCRFPDRPPRPGSDWLRREIEGEGLRPEPVADRLRREGYRTLVAPRAVYGLRGRLASIGHWIFHAGLLALLVAGGWRAAGPDPFRGRVGVGEGERFELGSARLVSANRAVDPALPPLRFRLERVEVRMERGGVSRFDAALVTPEGEAAAIGINRPYRSDPYQVLLHGFGYMPGWVVVDSEGHARSGAWLKLLPFPFEEEDGFSLGPADSAVSVRFHPDSRREGQGDRSPSPELRDPRFDARVVWRGAEVYRGLLKPGERVPLEPGREFFFLPEIRRYGLLDVVEESGHAPIFACFGFMILGLFMRYVRTRKEIVVVLGERSAQLHGHGEIFEHLFAEELDRFARELARPEPASPAPGAAA
jgi:hypothetical protein